MAIAAVQSHFTTSVLEIERLPTQHPDILLRREGVDVLRATESEGNDQRLFEAIAGVMVAANIMDPAKLPHIREIHQTYSYLDWVSRRQQNEGCDILLDFTVPYLHALPESQINPQHLLECQK